MYEHFKKKSAIILWKKLQDRLEQAKLEFHIFKLVTAVVKKFDGKKITKRIQTALRKELSELSDYVITLDSPYSTYEIVIWNRKPNHCIGYQNRMSITLGHCSAGNVLNMEKFDEHTRCWQLEKYIKQLSKITKEQMKSLTTRFNTAIGILNKVDKKASEIGIEYYFYKADE